MNLPNSITFVRILSIPLLIWVLSTGRIGSAHGEKELLASALFIAASITDGIDGYLARKRGQITTMGILLDPLADKMLIASAYITLVQFNPSLVPAWVAVIVIGREFLVSGLRGIAASEGFTIEASELGKFKMVVQIVSVVAVILDHRWKEWPLFGNVLLPGALDCVVVDMVHGVSLVDLGGGLFRGVLVEDRSPSGEDPAARVRSEPPETQCRSNLLIRWLAVRIRPNPYPMAPNTRRTNAVSLLRWLVMRLSRLVLEHAHGQENPGSHLEEPRGVFTTLYLHGKLRGCVGYVVPVLPLHRAVFETARAAASQ